VAVDLVQDGNDTQQLVPMMKQAQAATGSEGLVGSGGCRLCAWRAFEGV